MQILLSLAIALFAGLMLSRLAKLVKLPAVTAYLVAGILIGPFLLGAVEVPFLHSVGISGFGFIPGSFDHGEGMENAYSLICDVALGFIAFSIGNEFRLGQLKKTGKQATVIGIFQAVITTLLVDAALIALHFAMSETLTLPTAIVLGAIAAATAPAATLMVVRQYKAKGPLTDILLPIVALDDAVGLILFSASFGVAKAIMNPESVSLVSIIVEPLLEIVLSLLLGFVMGMLFTFFERFFHSRSKRLSMSVTFVLLTVVLSMIEFPLFGLHVRFSPLLVCMMLGTVFCNCCDFSEELMDRLDRWTAPLFILFFVISGAELDLTVFASWAIVLVGVVYLLARSAGKYSGALLSAKAVRCDKQIVKYLGVTLLPQAGVALGMANEAREALGETGAMIANITLFAVLVYELIGPLLTKIALTKAGEIIPEGKTSARAHFKKHGHVT